MNKTTPLPLQKVISLLLFFFLFAINSYGQDCRNIEDFTPICIGTLQNYPAQTEAESANTGNNYWGLKSSRGSNYNAS